MIRIAHTADIHIGMENYGRVDEATGLHSRVVDFLACWDQLIDVAVAEGVDAFVFAGDAFKTREPNPTYQREFQRRIVRLAVEHNITCLLVPGNHDLPLADSKASSIEAFRTLRLPNVRVYTEPTAEVVELANGKRLHVAALPWVVPQKFLGQERFRGKAVEAVGQEVMAAVGNLLIERSAQAAAAGDAPKLFLSHASVSQARFGSERDISFGHDWLLPLDFFRESRSGGRFVPRFSYAALGHIHRHQLVGGDHDVPVVYAGSISRINFGEEREPKGFVLADLDVDRAADWRFVELPARRFLTLAVDLRTVDAEGFTAHVIRAVEARAADVREAVVKVVVRLRAAHEETLSDVQVRRAVEAGGASHFAGLFRESDELAARRQLPDGGGAIAALQPAEVFARYLEARSLRGPEAARYQAVFAELLAEHASCVAEPPPADGLLQPREVPA